MPKGQLKNTGGSAPKLWRGRLHLNPSSFHVIAEAPHSTGEWNAFSSRKDVLYPHECCTNITIPTLEGKPRCDRGIVTCWV
eukprot:scaffold1955_cov106-Skeletonema_dohrnii-CCMP3373.AAC.8